MHSGCSKVPYDYRITHRDSIDKEFSRAVVRVVSYGQYSNDELFVDLLRAEVCPVLGALVLAMFLDSRQHNDDAYSLLPDHSPEIVQRLIRRSLRTQISFRILPALDRVSVDVVGPGLFFDRSQFDSGLVV